MRGLRRLPFPAWAAFLTLLVSGSSRADEPDAIFAVARAGVVNDRVEKSKALGHNDPKRTVTDLPARGALLVGFECGVGKFADTETVYALRPLYLAADGDDVGQDLGLFNDRRLPNNKTLKTRVLKKVRLQAQPGYAVGGVTLRTGLNIDGMSVTFMKIAGRTLDPTRSYTSEWVGNRTGGKEVSINLDGSPVVGVFATKDEEHVYGLGLLFVNEPPPAAPESPRQQQPQVPAEPPAKQPKLPAPKKAKPAQVEEPAPKPELEEPPPPAAKIPPPPAAKPAAPAESGLAWLPFAVFGAVVVVVLGVSLVFLNASRRALPHDPKARQRGPGGPRIDDEELRRKAPRPVAKTKPADDEDIPWVELADEAPQTGVCTELPAAPTTPLPAQPRPPAEPARSVPGGGLACPSCRRPVGAEAALRPWCPHCGEDLTAGATANASQRASGQPDPTRDLAPFGQPPSFNGRADRTFRIYVLADELLFLDAPASEDRSQGENMARNIGVLGGGLIGGMIGGAIADQMAAGRKAEARRRRDFLDCRTTDELQEMADHERTSFRAEVAGFGEASIVVLTWWERWFTENTAARLRFHHRDRGPMTLALPTPQDVRTAIQQLSALLGDALTVNAVWDYGSNRYVRGS